MFLAYTIPGLYVQYNRTNPIIYTHVSVYMALEFLKNKIVLLMQERDKAIARADDLMDTVQEKSDFVTKVQAISYCHDCLVLVFSFLSLAGFPSPLRLG